MNELTDMNGKPLKIIHNEGTIECSDPKTARDLCDTVLKDELFEFTHPMPYNLNIYYSSSPVACFEAGNFSEKQRQDILERLINEQLSPQFDPIGDGFNIKALRNEIHIFHYWCTHGTNQDKSWRRLTDGKRVVPLSEWDFRRQKEFQFDFFMDWKEWCLENWKTDYEIYDAKAIIDGLKVKLLFKSINYYPEVSYEKLFSQNNIKDVKMIFDSSEFSRIGTWINGKVEKKSYDMNNEKSKNDRNDLYYKIGYLS